MKTTIIDGIYQISIQIPKLNFQLEKFTLNGHLIERYCNLLKLQK